MVRILLPPPRTKSLILLSFHGENLNDFCCNSRHFGALDKERPCDGDAWLRKNRRTDGFGLPTGIWWYGSLCTRTRIPGEAARQ
jgi:hypothetical protein